LPKPSRRTDEHFVFVYILNEIHSK
jgi:hypothetical protein